VLHTWGLGAIFIAWFLVAAFPLTGRNGFHAARTFILFVAVLARLLLIISNRPLMPETCSSLSLWSRRGLTTIIDNRQWRRRKFDPINGQVSPKRPVQQLEEAQWQN
jgi:hypothetical protein